MATSNHLKDCGKQLGPLLKGQGIVHLERTQSGVCQSFSVHPTRAVANTSRRGTTVNPTSSALRG